ncbi:hypothetical protein SDC9_171422 [bioreactor metagenome]|uniref:Uncharacterized protein n=1 Tax=bioreactor metagenome TaxID=1076179 RepID=A0A645GE30_9ZZZZ
MKTFAKLFFQVGFRVLLPIGFFRSKGFRNRKNRHHRSRIDIVKLYFTGNFYCIFKCFRDILKNFPHLFRRLQVFLFRIAHSARIIQIFSGTQTNQTFMTFPVFFLHEVYIISGNEFCIGLSGKFYQFSILTKLFLINGAISIGFIGFVKL